MTIDLAFWNALVSTATLIVVATASIAAFRQIRHLRAQTSLAGFLKLIGDWRDPDFKGDLEYVLRVLPSKLAEPGYLNDLDARVIDRTKHRELNVCDWYEQIGSFMKYALIDESILLDVVSSSSNAMWGALQPVINRMRRTRGEALYENFEYLVARGVLFQRAHPHGCYPKNTPRMAQLGEPQAYGKAVTPPAVPAVGDEPAGTG